MDTRLLRRGALATLPLLIALLGCALSDIQTSAASPPPTTHEVAQTTTLPYGATGPATATCPQGEIALGGGWSVPQNKRVFATKLSGNAWSVSVTNPLPSVKGATADMGAVPLSALVSTPVVPPVGITVTAYVECLVGATNAVVTPNTQSIEVLPTTDRAQRWEAVCPEGEVASGSAFDLSSSTDLELAFIAPTVQGPHLAFAVKNYDSAAIAHEITYTAECLANAPGLYTSSYGQGASPLTPGATGDAAAACPAGRALAGGGAGYSPDNAPDRGNIYLQHAGLSGWQIAVYSMSGSITPYASALCI
jgi:hypothetical protein